MVTDTKGEGKIRQRATFSLKAKYDLLAILFSNPTNG